jgi:FkbM family methyltransferase
MDTAAHGLPRSPRRLGIAARWRLLGLLRRVAPGALDRERALSISDELVIWARLGDVQGALLFVYGTTEFLGTQLVRSLLEPADTVVDVGANLGEYTLIAARRVGPAGRVFAFEPHPGNNRLLTRSIETNGLANVDVFPFALSDARGQAFLDVSSGSHSGLARLTDSDGSGGNVAVACETLDTVRDRERIPRVALLKIDVEGFEPAVLRGAERTLTEDRPAVFFEANDLVASADGFASPAIDLLRAHGYGIYGATWLGGNRWRLARVAAGDDPGRFRDRWMHEGYPPNLLAVHPEDARSSRRVEALSASG